jgi:hypothetical protein
MHPAFFTSFISISLPLYPLYLSTLLLAAMMEIAISSIIIISDGYIGVILFSVSHASRLHPAYPK